MRQTVGAAASGTFAARCPAIALIGHASIPGRNQTCSLRFWRPLLHHLSYGNTKTSLGIEPAVSTHTRRAPNCAQAAYKNSSGSPPGLLVGAHPVRKLHLGKDSKAFSWHGRLHVRPCGLSSPCAIWCETVDSNHAEREVRAPPQTLRAAALNGAVPKSRIEAARNVKREQSPVPASRKGGKCQEGTRFGGCVHRFAFWLFR